MIGVKNVDKLPENEIKIENKVVKWFKNYWYYYKWRVIAVVFVLIVAVVCLGQTCSNSSIDIKIIYGGTYPSAGNDVPAMEAALSSAVPDGYTKDGKKKAAMVMFNYYTDEQIAEAQKIDPMIRIDPTNNRQELNKFKDSVVSGDAYLCLLDPSLYAVLDEMGLVAELSEILGYVPENSIDGKAIKLSDTEFGNYFEGFKNLPETYVCVRLPGVIQSATGKGKDSHEFEAAKEMFKNIVEYKAPIEE